MGILNGEYIHVVSEEVERDAQVLEHPVENGFNVSDHVKSGDFYLSLSGLIVGANGKNASEIFTKISQWQQQGVVVSYTGRNILNRALITSFETSYSSNMADGCEFSMELKQLRVSKSPLNIPNNGVLKQIEKQSTAENVYHTVKKGDTIWGLVHNKYNGYGFNVDWIIANNKGAFIEPGNPRTLKVGAVINMGARKQ